MSASWEIVLLALILVVCLSTLASWIIDSTLNKEPSGGTQEMNLSWPFSLNEAAIAAAIVIVIASISALNLSKVRVAAVETSALVSIRAMNAALMEYKSAYGAYPLSVGDLQKTRLGQKDPLITSGIKGGYRFEYDPQWVKKDGQEVVSDYFIIAKPVGKDSGKRTFRTNENGTLDFSFDGSIWRRVE